MKIAAILGLSVLTSLQAFAGGSQFACRSTDGSIMFKGWSSDAAVVTNINTFEIKDKNGKKLGLMNSDIYTRDVKAVQLPDFGSPTRGLKDTKSVVQELMQTLKAANNADATSESRLVALGEPRILSSDERSQGRDIGDFVYTQNFSLVEVLHTPKYKQADGSNFSVTRTTKTFVCQSSYATTCGGGCNAPVEGE